MGDAAITSGRMLVVASVTGMVRILAVAAERLHDAGRQPVVSQLKLQALAWCRRHIARRHEGAHNRRGQQDRYERAPFSSRNRHNSVRPPMPVLQVHRILVTAAMAIARRQFRPKVPVGIAPIDQPARVLGRSSCENRCRNIGLGRDLGNTDTKILIVDDHALLREGLQSLLSAEPGMRVVGTADSAESGIEKIGNLSPDVVLTDLAMPETGNVDAIRLIREAHPDIRILALTFHKEDGYIHAALQAGADGYVLKDDSRDELVIAIGSVKKGKNYLSPAICDRVIEGYLSGVKKKRLEPSWHALTRRERQVIRMIAEGLKTREIAEQLSLSPKTVEKHRTNMMNKLDLHSVSAVTLYAIQSGLVSE
jgi:DNA-binding NarL/FixJ family response regulator